MNDDQAIEDFEVAWIVGDHAPDILHAVKQHSKFVATEMVLIDMECRWRFTSKLPNDAIGAQPRWDDYLRVVGDVDDSLRLRGLAEEYRSRQLWGDQPNHDHFVARLPGQTIELSRRLRKIDAELNADGLTTRRKNPPSIGTPDPRAPLPFHDFTIQQHIGSGGMGRVYRAHQISLDRPVAIKALRKSFQQDSAYIDRFLEEAKLLAKLEHPNILNIYGVGQYPGGGYFIAMQFVDGNTLDSIDSQLPAEEAIRIAVDVIKAIGFAHENQILHGDLKPQNVLVSHQLDVLVIDFGLAQKVHHDQSLTSLGGTTTYLAPEVANGKPMTVAADIYGLGFILQTLADYSSSKNLLAASENCLHPSPHDRPTSANEVLKRLSTEEV